MSVMPWLGECLKEMAELGDKSIDHIITDPPYSAHVHSNARSNKRTVGDYKTKIPHEHVIGFDHLPDHVRTAAAEHFARLARRWVLVFCEVEGVSAWKAALETAGLEYIRTGAWVRLGTMPQQSGDRPATGFETIVIAHRPGRKKWNGGGRAAVWSHPIVNQASERCHPTQKPESLMQALIRDFTDVGDCILDPFMGSGTTLVAAKRLGRRAVGFDSNAAYVDIAKRRIEAAREQLGLFAEGA